MGMSYKRAWSLVQALNDGFGAPLVETARGGTGQGASLTRRGPRACSTPTAGCSRRRARPSLPRSRALVARYVPPEITLARAAAVCQSRYVQSRHIEASSCVCAVLWRVWCSPSVFAASAHAAQVQVAVAANFTGVLDQLAAAFKAKTGDELVISSGATGALYTQITQGAPFEVFLSADNKRPAAGGRPKGFGVDGTVFTYAVGKVVLYSTTLDVTDGEAVLKAGDVPAHRDRRSEDRALWRCRRWR